MDFWLQRAKVLGELSVQLVYKTSNLCDHNPATLQTDRRKDGQTDGQYAIARPRFACALHGKNVYRSHCIALDNISLKVKHFGCTIGQFLCSCTFVHALMT